MPDKCDVHIDRLRKDIEEIIDTVEMGVEEYNRKLIHVLSDLIKLHDCVIELMKP